MNCVICASDETVDSVMWTCAGCPRRFHPACVGISTLRVSLRKKDKKVYDTGTYIIPCCEFCQEFLQMKLEFKALAEQQEKLTQQLNANTEVMHRFALQQEKPNVVHEAVEGLETLLLSIKTELAEISKRTISAGSAVSIKNHVTQALDISLTEIRKELAAARSTCNTNCIVNVQTMMNDLAASLDSVSSDFAGRISDEINQLSTLSLEMAAGGSVHNNSMCSELRDDIKTISEQIKSLNCHRKGKITPAAVQPDPLPSIQEEINNVQVIAQPGWRLLGTRKVWKADWCDYDARQLRRAEQQKIADKARKKRKQAKTRYLKNARQSNAFAADAYPFNFRNCDGRSNFTMNNNNNNYLSKQNNRNTLNLDNRNRYPPSDRELLAAAKDQFSTPPITYHPKVRFERGEILNPYPAVSSVPGTPGGSCEACGSRPSFRIH